MYQTIDNLIICNGRKNVKIPKGNQKPPIKGQTILPSQQRGRKDSQNVDGTFLSTI
jgi:hypothetical protein